LGLNVVRSKEPSLAKICADQIYDNCLLAAGLLDDSQSMLRRINDLLLSVVTQSVSSNEVAACMDEEVIDIPSSPIEAEVVESPTSLSKDYVETMEGSVNNIK